MRIKPTHTESDVRTEYLCVCRGVVCWYVGMLVCEISRQFFFGGAGREREREMGAYHNYEYIVCSTIRTDSSFSRGGGLFGILFISKS